MSVVSPNQRAIESLSRDTESLELRACAAENRSSQEAEMDRIHLGRFQHQAGEKLVNLFGFCPGRKKKKKIKACRRTLVSHQCVLIEI